MGRELWAMEYQLSAVDSPLGLSAVSFRLWAPSRGLSAIGCHLSAVGHSRIDCRDGWLWRTPGVGSDGCKVLKTGRLSDEDKSNHFRDLRGVLAKYS